MVVYFNNKHIVFRDRAIGPKLSLFKGHAVEVNRLTGGVANGLILGVQGGFAIASDLPDLVGHIVRDTHVSLFIKLQNLNAVPV